MRRRRLNGMGASAQTVRVKWRAGAGCRTHRATPAPGGWINRLGDQVDAGQRPDDTVLRRGADVSVDVDQRQPGRSGSDAYRGVRACCPPPVDDLWADWCRCARRGTSREQAGATLDRTGGKPIARQPRRLARGRLSVGVSRKTHQQISASWRARSRDCGEGIDHSERSARDAEEMPSQPAPSVLARRPGTPRPSRRNWQRVTSQLKIFRTPCHRAAGPESIACSGDANRQRRPPGA